MYIKNGDFQNNKIKSDHSLSSLLLSSSFPLQKFLVKYFLNQRIYVVGPSIFYQNISFASPTAKTRWTMSVDNVDLKNVSLGDLELYGHSDIFFVGVKWSRDEFNNQSHS